MITDQALVLIPGLGDKKANVNDKIKIIRPDSAVIQTRIKGITFNLNFPISTGDDITKVIFQLDQKFG